MFTQHDIEQIGNRGIAIEEINRQLEHIKNGFPYLRLEAAASVENCIMVPTDEEARVYRNTWGDYLDEGHRVVKFVPASGAASRMFKNLFSFISADYDEPTTDFERAFFDGIKHFAFREALCAKCRELYGKRIKQLKQEGRYKDIVRALLMPEGLNYGNLPKGLLQFHEYDNEVRTPMEEHLVEAALYAASNGEANVHFTVSHDHMPLFRAKVEQVIKEYESRYGIRINASFSEQKPSTDTIAGNADGTPFRQEDGTLLFRPGGHGSLIENLGEMDADVVFIKNIDNVVPDRLKAPTVDSKKLLAGILVSIQQQAFECLESLDEGNTTIETVENILGFIANVLHVSIPEGLSAASLDEKISFAKRKLNRPMRVCGVVKNVGEPGGGPFLAYGSDGTVQPQILESSQIDKNNEDYVNMFKNGTHFNPVDLVCAIRDYKGQRFNLSDFVDEQTGFISDKSAAGRELKALERPGLWNGAMSDWNTVFVEVPLDTFNPVKTVNDLLRPQHQGKVEE